jgi:CO/xanthine dehydrogenase Mo-binding subunit
VSPGTQPSPPVDVPAGKQSNVVALTVALGEEQLAELAARVSELLPSQAPERLLTVDELAEMLGTSQDWVRRHQAELGGYRLSDGGGRNPVRFRMSVVEKFLADRQLVAPARAAWREDPDWSMG